MNDINIIIHCISINYIIFCINTQKYCLFIFLFKKFIYLCITNLKRNSMRENLEIKLAEAVENVKEGIIDGFPIWAELSQIEGLIKTSKESIKPVLLRELDNNDGKIERNGIFATITQSGRYNYSSDPVWADMSDALKKREKVLQAAYKMAVNGNQLITEDGEIVCIPEYIQSEKSIKITK